MPESSSLATSPEERLRRIESVTDRASSHLDLPELLEAMLDRVKEMLAVDTATVLLVDPAGSRLIATAAAGLEEEVRQGVRIPIGRGFAGRVAATRRPVVNPILREKGIRSHLR